MKMKTIQWGIIGCGDVTEVKSGPALQKAKKSALVAVMRRDAAKAEDYAARHKVARWYDDADRLINDPDVHAVYIATPPDTHMEYTLRVASAGKPVYVEKPMARSEAECKRMIEACNKAGVPLFTAYYRRSLPRFLKIRELLIEQKIGTVRSVHIILYQPPFEADYDPENLPWRVIPAIAGAGYFLDLASHTLDILDYLIGPVKKVRGTALNQGNHYPAEDMVTCEFQYESGAVGTGLWCFTAGTQKDQVEIIGTKGKISFSTFSNEPVIWETRRKRKTYKIKHPAHIQQPHIQSIVNQLNNKGTCPSNGRTAVRTSWVMDQILKDWRKLNSHSFDGK
jgi:predicted dehydrogenase